MDTKYKQFTRFVQTRLFTVVLLATGTIGGITPDKLNAPASLDEIANQAVESLRAKESDMRAAKIDAYFAKYNLPLAGHGKDFVEAADQYGFDPYVVASIGMIESTGGKYACKTVSYNAWGWGSCKYGFTSYRQAIFKITEHLSGQNEKTAKWYANKDLDGILDTYNPPSIRHDYKPLVKGVIAQIDGMDIGVNNIEIAQNN